MTERMKWALVAIAGILALGVVAALILAVTSRPTEEAAAKPTTDATSTSTSTTASSTTSQQSEVSQPGTTSTTTVNNDAEAVEVVRRYAAELRTATGLPTTADLMTDRQLVNDMKAICRELTDLTLWDRLDPQKTSYQNPPGEFRLLFVKLSQAGMWYCPEHRERIGGYLDALADLEQ